MSTPPGTVYLVGAGPGDVGLLTLRGRDCLRRADVVVYDNLANEQLLQHVPAAADLVFAGKEASQHNKSQDEINAILVERALQGQTVVRLKGGDPFLFGRGGEEAAYLVEHGVPFEVVPGITSAIAVPAYAGIPVTHRDVNGSLHIVTGHENVEGVGPDIDWSVLARSQGTIVFLMGVGNLEMITGRLMMHGMSGDTPLAMVRWGTRADQRTVVTTIAAAAVDIKASGLRPPAVGIIGKVVNLRETLAWVEKKPLFGHRIALTRPAGQNDLLDTLLRQSGAETIVSPTIQLKPRPVDKTAVANAVAAIVAGRLQWIVISSANGARLLIRWLMDAGHDARALAGAKVLAIGPRTASELRTLGLQPDHVLSDSRQEGATDYFAANPPEGAILLPGAADTRPLLNNALAAQGAQVISWSLYDTLRDERGCARLARQLAAARVSIAVFTSALTFERLVEGIPADEVRQWFANTRIAVLGSVTAAAVQQYGLQPWLVASEPRAETLAQEIAARLTLTP